MGWNKIEVWNGDRHIWHGSTFTVFLMKESELSGQETAGQ